MSIKYLKSIKLRRGDLEMCGSNKMDPNCHTCASLRNKIKELERRIDKLMEKI